MTTATTRLNNCQSLLGESIRLTAGTVTHAGIGAGTSVITNYLSFLGKVSVLPCAIFTGVDYLVSQLASPLFQSMKKSDACKDGGLLYCAVVVLQYSFPRAIALVVCAVAGLSLPLWQFVALIIAHAVLPYLIAYTSLFAATGIFGLFKYTDEIELPCSENIDANPAIEDSDNEPLHLLAGDGDNLGGVQQGDGEGHL